MSSYKHKDSVESFWERMRLIHPDLTGYQTAVSSKSGIIKSMDLKEICEQEQLTLIEELDGSSSHCVAHVRTKDGEEALLKAIDPDKYGDEEILALQLWQDTQITPKVLKIIAPGIHLREWVEGNQLDSLPHKGAEVAKQLGEAMRILHLPLAENTEDFPSVLVWLRSQIKYFQKAKHITAKEKSLAIKLIEKICENPGEQTLLHGDVYYRNVLYNGYKLELIDPRGYRGPPAFDIACYVSMTPGADPRKLLAETLEGYGRQLEYGLELTLIFVLRSIERFRGEHGLAGKEAQWRELADKLLINIEGEKTNFS
jgi:streptomycin 6-kinase